MFRAIFELLLTIIVIFVIRSVISIALKGFSQAMRPPNHPEAGNPGSAPPRPGQIPVTGELKKDPVCGTYISTATSIKEKVGGQIVHFCSSECRDKYVASSVH